MGCLYQIESPIGKRYIGITIRSLNERWRVHRANAKRSNGYLQNAINKYGADNFKVTALVIANDYEYLKELERKAIAVFNTKAPHGYNMTDGGDGVVGVITTAAGRIKRSTSQLVSFSDPKRKQRHLESQQTMEIRQLRSIRQKSINVIQKERVSDAMRAKWRDEEYLEKMRTRAHKPRIDDGLSKSARHRLKDLDGYRRKKRLYAKTPEQRAKRAAYMRKYNARKRIK
jgi:group I intron endonuclease